MKKILSLAACALFALLSVSCESDIFDPTDPYGHNDNTPAFLDGNTLTYGEHNYVLKLSDTEGSVTFTHFPSRSSCWAKASPASSRLNSWLWKCTAATALPARRPLSSAT